MFVHKRMLVSISGISDSKFKKIVHKAVEFYAGLLLSPRISKHITIDIEFSNKLDNNADGYCDVEGYNSRNKPREFTIQVRKNKSKRYMMMTLAHEMVHVKQFAMGELHENMNAWKGKRLPSSVDYWDTPWEIEAHGREYGLYSRFAQKHNVRYKKTAYERDN